MAKPAREFRDGLRSQGRRKQKPRHHMPGLLSISSLRDGCDGGADGLERVAGWISPQNTGCPKQQLWRFNGIGEPGVQHGDVLDTRARKLVAAGDWCDGNVGTAAAAGNIEELIEVRNSVCP
jgi:hypothetical protein